MNYISSIFSTGAVRKTPKRIIQKILAEIDSATSASILEFGAGKGEITIPLIRQKIQAAGNAPAYYAFEIDEKFSASLQQNLPGLQVISENAFDFQQFIPRDFHADYIICSIPLSFYSREKIAQFLSDQQSRLTEKGKLIILFHAFWLIPFLKSKLPGSVLHGFATIPPYFLIVFQKNRP